MRRLAREDAHDAEAFARLVPELDARRLPAPVLAVQVTRPAGGAGAVAVGVSIGHAVADGHAVWQFLRAWSTASREGPGSLAAPGFVQQAAGMSATAPGWQAGCCRCRGVQQAAAPLLAGS